MSSPRKIKRAKPADLKALASKKLESSGLTDADRRQAGWPVLTGEQAAAELGDALPKGVRLDGALKLDHYDVDGNVVRSRYRSLGTHYPFGAQPEKPIRYLSPRGGGIGPHFVRHPNLDWPSIAADTDRQIVITEGELKGQVLAKCGYPAIALPGVWAFKSRKRGHALLPELARVTWAGRQVVIVFDSDATTNEDVRAARADLAQVLIDKGAKVSIGEVPGGPEGGKRGIDDHYVAEDCDESAVQSVIESAEEYDEPFAMLPKGPIRPHHFGLIIEHDLFGIFSAAMARMGIADATLRFNIRSQQAEIGGQNFDQDQVASELAQEVSRRPGGLSLPPQMVHAHLLPLARRDSYDPFVEWLDALPPHDGRDWIGELCTQSLRLPAEDKVSRDIIQMFLISPCARAYEPGAKVDTNLMLIGDQGAEKSTWVATLCAKPEWLNETAYDISKSDTPYGLMGCVIWEQGEDAVRGRAARDAYKNFTSQRTDKVRKSYGRDFNVIPRRFVSVITANFHELLDDPSGGRRYLPVVVPEHLDTGWLREHLLQVWSHAKALYEAGTPWWVDERSSLAEALRERRRDHEVADPLEDKLREVMGKATAPLTMERIIDACHAPHMGHLTSQRVSAMLRKLGYKSRRVGRGGSGGRVFGPAANAITDNNVVNMSRPRKLSRRTSNAKTDAATEAKFRDAAEKF